MNLRKKKDQVVTNNVLSDKTNVKTTVSNINKLDKAEDVKRKMPAKSKKARIPLECLSPVKNTMPTKSVLKSLENTAIVKKTKENKQKVEKQKPSNPQVNKPQKEKRKPSTPQVNKFTKDKENRVPGSPYCFGFSDSDLESEILPYNGELVEFDNSKPYRLALYVKPSKRIRLDQSIVERVTSINPSLNLTRPVKTVDKSTVNNTTQNAKARSQKQIEPSVNDTLMSPNRTQWKVPFSSTPIAPAKKKGKLVQKKITDVFVSPKRTRAGNSEQTFVSYFETSQTEDEEDMPSKTVTKKTKNSNIAMEDNHSIRTLTSEESSSEDAAETTTQFRKPGRRSYIKKSRPAAEPDDNTPSDEILKSIEKKKKSKPKKPSKEEEEFEKWSQSMNSMFTEVDQFEISFD